MTSITIDINSEVMDWLTKRALAEKCTVEDFATFILNAVCINSISNQKQNETKQTPVQEVV